MSSERKCSMLIPDRRKQKSKTLKINVGCCTGLSVTHKVTLDFISEIQAIICTGKFLVFKLYKPLLSTVSRLINNNNRTEYKSCKAGCPSEGVPYLFIRKVKLVDNDRIDMIV